MSESIRSGSATSKEASIEEAKIPSPISKGPSVKIDQYNKNLVTKGRCLPTFQIALKLVSTVAITDKAVAIKSASPKALKPAAFSEKITKYLRS